MYIRGTWVAEIGQCPLPHGSEFICLSCITGKAPRDPRLFCREPPGPRQTRPRQTRPSLSHLRPHLASSSAPDKSHGNTVSFLALYHSPLPAPSPETSPREILYAPSPALVISLLLPVLVISGSCWSTCIPKFFCGLWSLLEHFLGDLRPCNVDAGASVRVAVLPSRGCGENQAAGVRSCSTRVALRAPGGHGRPSCVYASQRLRGRRIATIVVNFVLHRL